jgi:hypothetical protein
LQIRILLCFCDDKTGQGTICKLCNITDKTFNVAMSSVIITTDQCFIVVEYRPLYYSRSQ